ncbi:MAG: hypothetical protein RLZZ303_151 [Candidatus Hydrogenedentota bacterium]|jgi:AcrR family transcriptional regulator
MPKLIDHDVYRAELLTKALNSFAESGFAALSMKQLAGALGISHGLLYHYFANKEQLFLQMTEQLAERLLQEMIAGTEGCASPTEKLERMLDNLERRDEEVRRLLSLVQDYARLMGNRAEGNGLTQIVREIKEQVRATLGLSGPQAQFLFTYSLGMLQGRTIDPEGTSYAEHRRILHRLMGRPLIATLDDEPFQVVIGKPTP